MSFDPIMSVCRGCLATKRRMVSATAFEAEFKDLTGIIISPSDGLPQWLCYECIALLQKCVRFRNKTMRSHYILCQYVLESVPFTCVSNDSHLSLTKILHYDLPSTLSAQTDQFEKPLQHTILDDTDISHITNLENVNVKDEPLFCDADNNINNIMGTNHCEEDSVKRVGLSSYDLVELDTKNICLIMSNHEERTEQEQVETQLYAVVDDIDLGIAVMKQESSSDHEISAADWCIEQPYDEIQIEQGETSRGLVRGGRPRKHKVKRTGNTSTPHRETNEAVVNSNDNSNYNVNDTSRSNVKLYICDECNKCFTSKTVLISHIRKHSNKTTYKCNMCIKRFKHKSTYKTHILTHTGKKPYKCDECKKSFSSQSNFKSHQCVHVNEKPYKCDVCMKSFRSLYHMNRHMTVHTGEKPYKCEMCMRNFPTMDALNVHARKHTDDIKYKCDICMKRLNDKSHYEHHIRTHTGEKPFKCDVCHKRFAYKGYYKEHMRIHAGDKRYKCEICNKCFVFKCSLKQHAARCENT